MRKSSKIVSILLAGAMALSSAVFTASAATANNTEVSDASTTIYFKVPLEEWGTPGGVYCHIYHVYGEGNELVTPSWQTKKEVCTKVNDTGLYSYDIDTKLKAGLAEGCDYALLFSSKEGKQTGNVTLSSECYGATVVTTGVLEENTEDSQKLDYVSVWSDPVLATKYGPKASLTSTGKVIGSYFPVHQPKAQIVSNFIASWAVINGSIITPEVIQNIMSDPRIDVTAEEVYAQYLNDYGVDAGTGNLVSMESLGTLLGISQETTEATEEVTEPVTEATELTTEPSEPATEITEPTTELTTEPSEPATETTEPTTELTTEATEPTTEFTTEPVNVDTYIVAGSDGGMLGVTWTGDAMSNAMTYANGVYTVTYTDVQPVQSAEIKVVKNGGEWIGDANGNNIVYNVNAVCDVTVTIDPATNQITISGDAVELVTDLEIEYIVAVGNGDGEWLNDVSWGVDAEINKMEQVSEKVYEITFKNVSAYDNCQFKFAANGSWASNWGATEDGVVISTDTAELTSAFDGNNITINNPYDSADITLTLDLTNFVYATKSGAVIKVSIKNNENEVIFGDLNNDGIADANDVTTLQMYLAQYDVANINTAMLDIDKDGTVDVQDVTVLQMILAGLVNV